MKLLKKTLAMLLCLIMTVVVLPLSANAASSFTPTLDYVYEYSTPGTVVISWSGCGFTPYKVRIYIGSELLKETTTSLYAAEVEAIPELPYTVRAYKNQYDYIESEEVVLNADEFFSFTKTPKAVVKSDTPTGYVDVEFGVSFKPVGITIIQNQSVYGSYKYGDRISVPISDKPYTIYVEYGNSESPYSAIDYDFYALSDNTYSISVTNGTASKTIASEGEKITLIANAAPAGKVFDKWVVTGATVANPTSATTTFTMPANNVTATATYKSNNTTVNNIAITDIDLPVANATPDKTATTESTFRIGSMAGIVWYRVENGTRKAMGNSEKFEAGKTYVCYMQVFPNSGYLFPSSKSEFSVTINGETAVIGGSYSNSIAYVEMEFIASCETHNFDGSVCTACGYDASEDCGCKCHQGGIAGFFYKIVLFFQKLFGQNKVCVCGMNH